MSVSDIIVKWVIINIPSIRLYCIVVYGKLFLSKATMSIQHCTVVHYSTSMCPSGEPCSALTASRKYWRTHRDPGREATRLTALAQGATP